MSHPAIIVGNRTGGQGKTLISQLLHCGFNLGGVKDMKPVAADTADNGDKSKLGMFLKDIAKVEELGTGARMSDIKNNQHSAVQYWDRLGSYFRKGNAIVDLGANILPLVFDWAVERKAGRVLNGAPMKLVVPITAQRQSMIDGVAMLKRSIVVKDQLPMVERYAILNQYHGSFTSMDDDVIEWATLNKLQKDGDIKIVHLQKCDCEVWEQIEAKFVPLAKLYEWDYPEYVKKFKIDEFVASGAETTFKTWIAVQLKEFSKAGLIPPLPTEKKEGEQQATEAAA